MRAIVVILLLGLASCSKDNSPDPLDATQHELVNGLNSVIKPIAGSAIANGDGELMPLDAVASATIVGLGEATHGSKEFFEMKHRIFKYLVEKHGFRAFAFEMDMAESTIFEDYVQGRNTTDLRTLMKTKMIFWTWATQEVYDLLSWMKSYNDGKGPLDKLHFYGFDCQFPKYNADFLSQRIGAVDPEFSIYIQKQLIDFKTLNYAGDSTHYKSIAANVTDVYNKIADHKDDLIARGMSLYDYEVAKGLARNVIQTHQVIYSYKVSDGTNYRDQYMAENAVWISSTLQGGNKICLWAHDYHIQNQANVTMGSYIASSIGSQYKKVGFAFSNGQFNAISNGRLVANTLSAVPMKLSTNYLFKNASAKNFILNLSQVNTSNPFYEWINIGKPFLTIGSLWNGNSTSYYGNTLLSASFDFVIYFDEVNHAVTL